MGFIKVLKQQRNYCLEIIEKESHKEMHLTAEEEQAFQKATTCWICEEQGFTEKTASPKNKTNQKHLRFLSPLLATCEMDMGKIPTIEEVKKLKRIQLRCTTA